MSSSPAVRRRPDPSVPPAIRSYTMGCFSVRSPDGVTVMARTIDPHHPNGVVCLLTPAMGTRAAFYGRFAQTLADRGYSVVTADLRGQGESSERASAGARFGYSEIIELDLPAVVAAVRARYPSSSLLMIAHSLGGQLATLSVTNGVAHPEGLVLIGAGTAYWRGWPRGSRLKARLAVTSIGIAGRLLPWYPGRRLGFGGNQPRRLMADWMHNALCGDYRSDGRSLEPRGWSRRIPVLSIRVRGDVVAPRGANLALVGRLGLPEPTQVTLEPTPGSNGWQSHFAWARGSGEVAATISEWALERIGVGARAVGLV